MRILPLDEATPPTSGGKASTLAALRRAGVDVPDGFVIPFDEYLRHHADGSADRAAAQPDPALTEEIGHHLARLLGGADRGWVAVRSSAGDEDGAQSSAAGQHDTVLAVRGTDAVAAAVARCWHSLHSTRATAYRRQLSDAAPQAMAVLIQRFVDADVSGVLFTGAPRVIEAVPGLGAPLVSGQITPDAWTLDDTGIVAHRPGTYRRRLDRHGEQLLNTSLPERPRPCLDDPAVHTIDRLGRDIHRALGFDADVEWALRDGRLHTLQARPITAPALPATSQGDGIPASPGVATGPTCVVRGPRDFHRFRLGDILVCRTTDPAWTPLFAHAAGVVTETGGLLSHAAIVARELGIPAVLSVPDATTRFPDGTRLIVDGATGAITAKPHESLPPGS